MSITGVRDVDEVPAEGTHGSDLPPNMSMSTVGQRGPLGKFFSTLRVRPKLCLPVNKRKN